MRTKIKALGERIAYYEWAYGRLAEADADIGPVAEFLVGRALGCLPATRSVNATYDLVMKDGRTVEVKATCKRQMQSNGKPIYRWDVGTQLGTRNISADIWCFLIADFPTGAAAKLTFDVFDPQYWTVYIAPGQSILSSGVSRYVTESLLRRLDISPLPLSSLHSSSITFPQK